MMQPTATTTPTTIFIGASTDSNERTMKFHSWVVDIDDRQNLRLARRALQMNDRGFAIVDEIPERTAAVEAVLKGESEWRGQRGSIPDDVFDVQLRRSFDQRDAIAQVLHLLA